MGEETRVGVVGSDDTPLIATVGRETVARSEQACARLINTFRIKSFSPLINRTADEGRQLAEESDYRTVPSDHELIEKDFWYHCDFKVCTECIPCRACT